MYMHVDAQFSTMAIQSLSNHLWYLVPELAVLAMLDTSVSSNEKLHCLAMIALKNLRQVSLVNLVFNLLIIFLNWKNLLFHSS